MKISLLSLFSIVVSLCLILNINYNINGVNAALSISRDRSDYIRKQLAIRSKALDDQLTSFSEDVNQVFEDKYGGLFFGLSTMMNTLSGLFGMLNLAIPCGGAAIISSAVLGVAQNAVAGSGGDIGSTIANGVKAIVDESLAGYNAATLAATLNSEKRILDEFYTDKIYLGGDIFKYADDVHTMFYSKIADFKLTGYEYGSIALFTLHANSHLLFLYDMVVNGAALYNIPKEKETYFINNFKQYIVEYRSHIDSVNQLGKTQLNKRISDKGYTNQDEWNLRNDYYNYMKLYVYDISNYWDYLRADSFPKGMLIENAHVSLSKLFGAPYKGDYHMSGNEIQEFIDSKKIYQYQGKFIGFYYKNWPCEYYDSSNTLKSFDLTKYFGARQYFFRDGIERDTFYLGDEGSLAGTRKFANFRGTQLDYVDQFNSRDGSPTQARDYFWGLGANNSVTQYNIGNTQRAKTQTKTEFLEKTVALAIPISYNDCAIFCKNINAANGKVLLVESAVLGFVNKDVKDTNEVIELTGTMIDAQKYNYASTTDGVYYSRDGYKEYKHSMSFPPDTRITYKIDYRPYDNKPGYFKFYIDLKTSGSTTIEVYTSPSDFECMKKFTTITIGDADSGKLSYMTDIKLNPSLYADNYITIQFNKRVFVSHLSFYSTE